jgi:phospholipid-translocating ATPase
MAPNDEIYDFKGVYTSGDGLDEEGLSLANTIWANTVLASSGFVLGIVLHTGQETRMAMNTSQPRIKIGKLDLEVNWLSKVLFAMMCLISFGIVALDVFAGDWSLKFFRMNLLLCSIIPISMRINLDLAKIYYSYLIQNDSIIPNCVVRNSTIPEELGRIQFLLTDKTGTLTQNDMVFKKIAMEFALFSEESVE